MYAKTSKAFFRVVLCSVFVAVSATAQTPPTKAIHYDVDRHGNRLVINGTSTITDWTVEGTQIRGRAIFKTAAEAHQSWMALFAATKDPHILVKIPVRSLKGDSERMSEAMYEAFRAHKNPYIIYRLDKIWSAQKASPGRVSAIASGHLTLAGTTRNVQVRIQITHPDDDHLQIDGRQRFNMRDFGIEPPSAMFGLLKADPHVHVSFRWELRRN